MTTTSDKSEQDKSTANKKSGRNKLLTWLGIVIGGLALFALIYWTGFDNISKALKTGGPALLLLALLYPIELVPRAIAWKWIYPAADTLKNRTFIMGMWIGQSLNRLLPTASIGGDVVRGRLLIIKNEDETDVVTSLIADKTAHASGTLMLLVLGLIMIMTRVTDVKIIAGLILACALLTVGIFLFIRLQRNAGVSALLAKWENDENGLISRAKDSAQTIESKLEEIYAKPKGFIHSVLIRVASSTAMAAEIWVAAWLIGSPISVVEAITLRLVSFGVRSMAFVVWGGLGIQEGAYALMSTFVGLPPATLVAISLATRVREIVVAIPGVIAWLTAEGLRATRKKNNSAKSSEITADSPRSF